MSGKRTIPKNIHDLQMDAADPDTSVFVSANAGSGKTHVLVQRVINLLLKGVNPATILCITYTKAAAANMSNRIFAKLAKWTALKDSALDAEIGKIAKLKIDADLRARARRLFAMALETPGGLKVQTIHAFCTRLLHQFPFEADVAARFTVMDESTTLQLLDQLTMQVLLGAAAQPATPLGRALDIVATAAADPTVKKLVADAIKQRDRLAAWIARAGGLDAAIAELSAALQVAAGETLQAIENEYFSGGLLDPADWQDFAAFLSNSDTATDQATAHTFQALPAKSGRERIDSYVQVFLTDKLKPRKSVITAKFAKANPQWNDRLAAEQRRIETLAARERAVIARDRTRALLTIALEVIHRYRAEKDRRSLLDYDDLIDKTAALFSKTSAAWVLYKLDAGIEHVLIDEAQDTSPRQWEIVRTIVSEFSPGGARPNVPRTLFAVGDEKQSIYSFQGADPRKFDEMRRHFERQFTNSEMGWRYVRLGHSFRSGANVLGAVDRVFYRPEIFASVTSDAAGIPEHKALPCTAPGLVELWPLIGPADTPAIEGWDAPFNQISETSPAVRLAQKIAGTIRLWRRQGTQPGDILILVRQRNALFESIIRALKQSGIAVAGADRLVLTDHIAVMDLLALADAVLLPQDDLALATVLKSPLFNLDEDQLFRLAWNRKGTLRAAMRGDAAGDDPTIAAAVDALDDYAVIARSMSPFAFYAGILGARGGRKAFLARLGPEAADALDEFLNFALDYEAREAPTLQGFIHWLRAAQNEIKRDMELSRNEVRVMTVHGAKGLEAKTVILADTTAKPTGPRDPRLLTMPGKGGAPDADVIVWAGAKQDDTAAIAGARQAAQIAAQNEYRRLLYVAMTRAADRLVICGVHGSRQPPEGCWHQLVADAFAGEATTKPAEDGDGSVLCYDKTRTKPSPPAPDRDLATPDSKAAPVWLPRPLRSTAPATRVVAPSDAMHIGRDARPPASAHKLALRRGTLMHRLLQSLPDIAEAHRGDTAAKYLSQAGDGFSAAERDDMAAQVLRLLDDPRFSSLFSAESRAEVSIVGQLSVSSGRTIAVAGQVDRVAIGASGILIGDYKTNRPAPESADEAISRYPGYVRQLALYRGVLAQLYPGRPVRAALIWTDLPDFMEFSPELLDASLAQVTSP